MSVTQKRVSYNASFKLSVINYAKEHGNRAAERHFGPPPTEKMIREWRRQEEPLKLLNKDRKTFRTHRVKWPHLEEAMKLWAMNEQSMGKTICTKTLSLMASRWAKANGIKGFQGSSSWCLRFLKTHGMLPEWFKCKRAEDKLVVDKSDSAKRCEDKLNVGHYKVRSIINIVDNLDKLMSKSCKYVGLTLQSADHRIWPDKVVYTVQCENNGSLWHCNA